MTKIKKVGFTLKPIKTTDYYSLIPNLVEWLTRRKMIPVFLETNKSRIEKFLKSSQMNKAEFWETKKFHKEPDLMLSLGGDGTLIGLCHRINSKIPIMGVNLGRLGFITEFNKKTFFDELEVVTKGKAQIDKISMTHIEVQSRSKKSFEGHFVNDAVYGKNDMARLVHLSVEANDEIVSQFSGDGVIISSTIGSTAYSLAAGGPIIHPNVKALCLTPICPHSLVNRPMVIPKDTKLSIKLLPPQQSVTLTLDGQIPYTLQNNDIVVINSKRAKQVKLISNPQRSFYQTLRDKLVKN